MTAIPGLAVPDRAFRLPQTHLTGLPGLVPATTNGPIFRCGVRRIPATANASDSQAGAFDDSGRAQERVTLLTKLKAKDGTIVDLRAGDRISVASRASALSDVYEIIRPVEAIRGLKKDMGFTTEAEKVSLLYAHLATITKLGGEVVRSNVPMSLYPAADERGQRAGVSQDWSGEAPYEYLPALQQVNIVISVDGRKLKISSATPHHTLPRVVLRMRESKPA